MEEYKILFKGESIYFKNLKGEEYVIDSMPVFGDFDFYLFINQVYLHQDSGNNDLINDSKIRTTVAKKVKNYLENQEGLKVKLK